MVTLGEFSKLAYLDALVTQPMLQGRPNDMELRSMSKYVNYKDVSEKFFHFRSSAMKNQFYLVRKQKTEMI